MVYDPSRPPPPPGQMGITSTGGVQGLPTQIPNIPLGGTNTSMPSVGAPPRPGLPSGGGGGGFQMPALPGGFQMPSIPGMPSGGGGGGITPGGMPPVPGRPAPPAGGVGGGFAGGGGVNIDGLRSFIDAYKNSIFEWLQGRPEDRTQMGAWRDTRPQFDTQGLLAALFAPPAPAPAPAADPAPTV